MKVTIEQLEAIFNAGRGQGSDEATSADWNTFPRRQNREAFTEALRDLLEKVGVEDVWLLNDEEVQAKITE